MSDTTVIETDLMDFRDEATNRLARELQDSGASADLFARIDAREVELTGDGALIPALIKTTLERGLQAEITVHLGYEAGDRDGCEQSGSRSSRNGFLFQAFRNRGQSGRGAGIAGPGWFVHPASGSQGFSAFGWP